MKREIKVEDYGDMLSQVTGKKLISYNTFGSYQGDWIAALEDGENIELWKGSYGSCSGCDWIEAEAYQDTVSLKKAKDYFKEDRPFAIIPKEMMERIDIQTFIEIMPANTRAEIYDFEPQELYEAILKGITNPLS